MTRDSELSRREILIRAGWGAAGVALGAGATAAVAGAVSASPRVQSPARAEEPGFDHLVVLMFENRSFDNVFGHLYGGKYGAALPSGQRFEGLTDRVHANTAPDGTVIPAHAYTGSTDVIFSSPVPNAGEEYPHINTQLFGVVDPPANAGRSTEQMAAPYNAPRAGATPTMGGFVVDYINNRRAAGGPDLTADEVARIMGGFTPQMLPVFSTLAREFAIYDHWHAAVPSQTFANRSFFHASTSSGFVVNRGAQGFGKWMDPTLNNRPTIFNRLTDAGLDWAVYFDESQLVSFTGLIHGPQLQRYWRSNFRTMTQFREDVATGRLPTYAFIEPRMIYNHNDMHPPFGAVTEETVDGVTVVGNSVSDARAAEVLLHEVYTSIKESAATSGSNAFNTMLLVTFDETGGTYDHVPPPPAVAPDGSAPGEFDFAFDRLGVRVPALAISAYTAPGTVINAQMHHAAVIRTLCERYDLPHLTERDRHARSLRDVIGLKVARDPATWPTTSAHFVPDNPELNAPTAGTATNKLTAPAVGLLAMLLAKYGQPGDPIPSTYGEAVELLEKHGRELFGT